MRRRSPCTVVTILFGLAAPPATFDPKADRPSWVLDVSVPDIAEGLELDDNARRIVVTIDGGGDTDGAGGGVNSISLTAGGRVTEEIDADDFTVPSFVRVKSRCGGPITLLVDTSGSIASSDMNNVIKPGVEEFINSFRGTPTRIQVVRFNENAYPIGPNNARTTTNGGWHRYIDMTNDADVDALLASVTNDLGRGGSTNWEEAFFRTFRESDGSPAQSMPNRVVFFTDGTPTSGRHTEYESRGLDTRVGDYVNFNAGPYDYTVGWPNPNTSSNYGIRYDQESWDRADVLLDLHRNVDLIFVGVGSGLNSNLNWTHNSNTYQDPSAPPASAVSKKGSWILAYMLANGPSGHVTAVASTDGSGNTVYTNAETADYYLQSSFDAEAFGAAMRAAALKDCGGTITLQTRHADTGEPISDEIVYENPTYRDQDDNPIPGVEPRFVTTSSSFRTGTFDFELSDAANWFNVDIVPSELQTLDGYQMTGWSCRSGATTKSFDSIPIPGSPGGFTGVTLELRADEAISCIMNVRPT